MDQRGRGDAYRYGRERDRDYGGGRDRDADGGRASRDRDRAAGARGDDRIHPRYRDGGNGGFERTEDDRNRGRSAWSSIDYRDRTFERDSRGGGGRDYDAPRSRYDGGAHSRRYNEHERHTDEGFRDPYRERDRSRERDRDLEVERNRDRDRYRAPRDDRDVRAYRPPGDVEKTRRRNEDEKGTKAESPAHVKDTPTFPVTGATTLSVATPANEMSELELMKAMGIPTGFDTTHGEHVDDKWSNASGVIKRTKRKTRQYMNRKGGFSKPLPSEKNS